MDDSKIVDLYLARDERAIQETSDKYGKQLLSLSCKVTEDPQTSDECVNDVYLQVWKSIPPNEPRDWFFAYLAKITRQVSLDAVKYRNRKKRSANMTELSDELEQTIAGLETPESEAEAQQLMKEISNYLRTLSEEKRTMFVRRYYFLDSIGDIAERYGVKETKVRTTLFRVRDGLKQYLEEAGYTV